MLTGNIGIEGGGVNPLRGQNNVQGACDMGGLPNVFTGYQPVTNADRPGRRSRRPGASPLSAKVGLTVDRDDPGGHEGRSGRSTSWARTRWSPTRTCATSRRACKKLDFLVVQDIFLTETARLADVVLPGACFAEKHGTFTNTERRVQRVRQAVDAPGAARAD